MPDRYSVEAHTTASEVADIARTVAEKLNRSNAPPSIMVPVLGWSSLSVKGGKLYNPEADASFVPALRETLKADVKVIEKQLELNSEEFACALVEELHSMIEAAHGRATVS